MPVSRNVAFLFPGQGSQSAGMGRDLAATDSRARELFDLSDRTLGFSLSQLCFEGPDERLRPTEIAQPALLACSVATLHAIQQTHPKLQPALTAGHSLGEYSALVAAGVLDFVAALRLVRRRGEWMAESAHARPGAMAAVLGLASSEVDRLCRSYEGPGVVVPANLNAPGQVVISGTEGAVQWLSARAKADGASRVIPLAVSGAFHSPLMAPAAEKMSHELDGTPFDDAVIPVVPNTLAEPVQDAGRLRKALSRQIESSVRWEESVQAMEAAGVTHYLEVGPGRVLSGLVKKIVPTARIHAVGDSAGLSNLAAFLES